MAYLECPGKKWILQDFASSYACHFLGFHLVPQSKEDFNSHPHPAKAQILWGVRRGRATLQLVWGRMLDRGRCPSHEAPSKAKGPQGVSMVVLRESHLWRDMSSVHRSSEGLKDKPKYDPIKFFLGNQESRGPQSSCTGKSTLGMDGGFPIATQMQRVFKFPLLVCSSISHPPFRLPAIRAELY